MRRGNMLVATLIACAILSVILVVGLRIISLEGDIEKTRLQYIQLEQLHRTAIDDTLKLLNKRGVLVEKGACLLEDQPVQHQWRRVVVESINNQNILLRTESTMRGGSKRIHHVQLWCFKEDARIPLKIEKTSLCIGKKTAGIANTWLASRATNDIVVCHDGAHDVVIGDGGVFDKEMQGNIYVCHMSHQAFRTRINSPLLCKGTIAITGDAYLSRDITANQVYIDGDLHITEGVVLQAEDVYLARIPDNPAVLKQIKGTIYMQADDEKKREDEEKEDTSDIQPLPEALPDSKRYYFFIRQQID